MPLALLLFLVVVSTGLGALRLLRLDRGWLGLGLAPAAGLSVVTIVATWADVAPLPEVIQTALLLALAVAGLLSAAPRARSFLRAGRLPVLLGLAILVPFAVLALAFAELEVPLSGHDGAHHIETIWALQHGARWSSWYPPGLHTMLAAILTGVPWVDTARAALDAAFGIALLAPLAAFGLGYTVTGRSGLAGVGALFLAFTVQYPYSPHLWSGWPVAAALLIALGLWSVGALYLRRPRLRLAVLAGLLLGAIVLVHGTELYTTALGLVILLVGAWRRVRWLRLLRDLLTAGGVAMIAALPYVPSVVGWAHAGGASDVAQEVLRTAATAQPNPGDAVMTLALGSLSGGFLLDLPIRAGLLALGLWLAVRRGRYRPLAALFAVAFGLALAFRYANVPVLSTIYAL
ncbi:MAG TPA: DUF6541 family protein, partial [Chloroflexota bacterium]|nr:DUF6541 family protein [Chloroflexota bacterium]